MGHWCPHVSGWSRWGGGLSQRHGILSLSFGNCGRTWIGCREEMEGSVETAFIATTRMYFRRGDPPIYKYFHRTRATERDSERGA
jgi:hypothetical protein